MAILQTAVYMAVGFAAGFFYQKYRTDGESPLDTILPPPADKPTGKQDPAPQEEGSSTDVEEGFVPVLEAEGEEVVAEPVAVEGGEVADLEAEAVDWDDLTKIKGIGAVIAKRFNEEGINSFADLAALTAEKAREIADLPDWHQSDPADWIAQAAELS